MKELGSGWILSISFFPGFLSNVAGIFYALEQLLKLDEQKNSFLVGVKIKMKASVRRQKDLSIYLKQ